MKKLLAIVSICLVGGLFACGEVEDDLDGGSSQSDAYVEQGPACGAACTDEDLCDGDTLKFCDNNVIVCYDCSGDGYHCALWTSGYGHDCLAATGQACSEDFPTNQDALVGCDPAQGLTCTGGTCQ